MRRCRSRSLVDRAGLVAGRVDPADPAVDRVVGPAVRAVPTGPVLAVPAAPVAPVDLVDPLVLAAAVVGRSGSL